MRPKFYEINATSKAYKQRGATQNDNIENNKQNVACLGKGGGGFLFHHRKREGSILHPIN